jgi:hypothetical protein
VVLRHLDLRRFGHGGDGGKKNDGDEELAHGSIMLGAAARR